MAKQQILSFSEFRDEIRAQLKPLSREQRVAFARRCALHALPYLYGEGHVDFWPKKKRLKHIYAVFNLLDFCHAVVILKDYHVDIKKIYVADAADAAAYAAYAYADADAYAADAAAHAARAAERFNQTNIQPLLRQELQAIINHQAPAKVNIDGYLLTNFEKALKNQKCDYWAKLYLKVFKDLSSLQATTLAADSFITFNILNFENMRAL